MKRRKVNKWVQFSGMGFQMGMVIFFGVWGGMKLDEMYPNKNQLFTVFLSLFAVFIALYLVIKQVNNLTDDDESNS